MGGRTIAGRSHQGGCRKMSIAIPSRRKAGSKSRRIVSDVVPTGPIAPSRRLVPPPPSRGGPVHRFAIGELVSVMQPSRLSVPQAGLYRIVRPMPYEGGALSYRVRGETDSTERVVAETDISLPDGATPELP